MYQSIQGNIGLGKAIEYFTSHGITVSLPLNDTQKYDLVVDMYGSMSRIQVKTSRYKKPSRGLFEVDMKHSGGFNRSRPIGRFDNTTCDYLFVYTAYDRIYLIPASELTCTCTLLIGRKYRDFEVQPQPFSVFAENVK